MRDFALREQAIPFLGQIAGYNRNDQSDFDVSQANALGDLYTLVAPATDGFDPNAQPRKNNLVRILQPQFVATTAAYFTFSLTTANNETSRKFYVTAGTGYTTANGVIPAIPSDEEIRRIHTLLKGDSQPYDTPNGQPGTVTIDKLNILNLLPKRGEANFRQDCFVIGIHFLQVPSVATGYKLNRFEVNCSGVISHG